jgi:hypothetical protein
VLMIPAPLSGTVLMPDTYRQHADELRARAASEYDPGRVRYLRGLASSYMELARQRGEWSKWPKKQRVPPAVIECAGLAAALRGLGYSQRRIAEMLGISQQLVSRILMGLKGAGRYRSLAALGLEQRTTSAAREKAAPVAESGLTSLSFTYLPKQARGVPQRER